MVTYFSAHYFSIRGVLMDDRKVKVPLPIATNCQQLNNKTVCHTQNIGV
jgi:hypothetical protein